MTAEVLQWVVNQLLKRQSVVLVTVLTTKGSVPGKTGSKMAMTSTETIGTIGGAGLELCVQKRCLELITTKRSAFAEVLNFGLNKGAKGYEVTALDSLCGGQVTVSLELMIPMPHVLLFGAGHCAEALAKFLPTLNWEYSVHDTRNEFIEKSIFQSAKELHSGLVADFFEHESASTLNRFSDIFLLGHDWSEDEERLVRLFKVLGHTTTKLNGKDAPRIGVIGSRSKWSAFSQTLLNEDVPQSMIDQIRCPIGLNIGAQSPEEIAIAVLAQILVDEKHVNPTHPTWRNQ